MATAKVKKKQIKDFAHEVDEISGHKASPVGKRGKLVRTNAETGEIELVDGARSEVLSGTSWLVQNVPANYQFEFYRKDASGNYTLFNVYHKYFPAIKTLEIISQIDVSDAMAVIKQV